MKKLMILKSIVDFIWIVTCIPLIPITLFFAVYMFINPEALHIVFNISDESVNTSKTTVQILGLLLLVVSSISIYCFYLFRKTLRYFQKVKPFHLNVINNFNTIGKLLTVVGASCTILLFAGRLILKSEFKINFGFSPYLMLICLGLFFMVLSEVFKVAKHAKEENELTI